MAKRQFSNTRDFSHLGFIILLLSFCLILNRAEATNYYFSNSTGDDKRTSAEAQSSSTPWKSIAKLNATTFAPGDAIFFNKGDTFYGSILINSSGTSSAPITFGAYGSGADPVITGFSTISSWTDESGSIYSGVITSESQSNMVTVDGSQQGIGRYPNTGYLTYESSSGTASITDNQLAASPVWTGAEVVIRKNPYVLDRNTITNHTGTLLAFTTLGSTTTANAGWGYFIQNDLKTLDVTNEWYHNTATGKFYIYGNPASKNVQVATLDYLFKNNGFDYITVTGLNFTGANKIALYWYNNADYGKVLNCSVNYSGGDGIDFVSSHGQINNTSINHINRTGIYAHSTFMSVTNNTIKNCGIIKGAATWGNNCIGIIAEGADNLYQYNSIDSVGYNGIYLVVASRSQVRNNLINHFCLNLNDGGGIYTAGTTSISRVIDGNIVLNGIGDLTGTTTTTKIVEGIYIDEPTSDIDITNNTCAFNAYSGLKLHNANNIRVRENTFFGNTVCALRIQESNASTPLRNNNFHGNKFIAKNSTELTVKHISATDDIALLGSLDSNYYARPIDDNLTIQTGTPTAGTVDRTLALWKTFSGQDANSQKSPVAITNTADLRFEYNATNAGKTIVLPGTYIDVTGITYANSITLSPYTSAVLIKQTTSGNKAPSIPNQSFSLNENSPAGTAIGTVTATDADAGQTRMFSIVSGNTGSALAINASTGVLSVATASAINFEATPSFALVVKVQDNGTGSLSSQATVTVTILNVNEKPVIADQTFSVNTFAANGTVIRSVAASDPDAGQALSWSIVSGNTDNAFAINPSTGVLAVANSAALDLQTNLAFALVTKVQDNGAGNLASQATVYVNLVNTKSCAATGYIAYQKWSNISGSDVSALKTNINYPEVPSSAMLLPAMEAPLNVSENFGARLAGYICAPLSGSYTFWIASDESSELWLSTDDNTANKIKIASVTGFTNSRQWDKYVTQKSLPVNLSQGQSYYIEALMKGSSGSDNFALG